MILSSASIFDFMRSFLAMKRLLNSLAFLGNKKKVLIVDNKDDIVINDVHKSPDELELEVFTLGLDLINKGHYEFALTLISKKVIDFLNHKNFLGKKIYLPLLDTLIVKIHEKLFSEGSALLDNSKKSDVIKVPIILATELYSEGGHSRIVEEFFGVHPDAIIILTNSFEGSGRVARPSKGIKNLPILVLPEDDILSNIARLNSICRKMASKIYHLGHHHDVTLNVALVNLSIPVYFIHHSDHKPSLGNTIPSFTHVDMASHVHVQCTKLLPKEPFYWPQGVSDLGKKTFQYPIQGLISASSGNHTKFDWVGDIAYPKLVRTILANNISHHYHIGAITEEQCNAIKSELAASGIASDRFVLINSVQSLWASLIELPINCFIGSAPVHGLRTAIEVQGAGIPILPYRQDPLALFMNEAAHYNQKAMYWSTLPDLCEQIKILHSNHRLASVCSRQFYENNFSLKAMKEAMQKADKVVENDPI